MRTSPVRESNPRFLVFQHVAAEHPGSFREFMTASGATWDAVELDEGESIPDLAGYDGLWVMGGPMDVWQKDEHPWLRDEVAAIHEAVVTRGMPFMGLCLGHQLLAEALGGDVGPTSTPEIGVLDVYLTESGRASPLMAGILDPLKCLQWHSAEVTRMPDNATCLMSSPLCAVQAMAVGTTAVSMQFHVEIETSTVSDWGKIPEYAEALEKAAGAGALEQMDNDASAAMNDMTAAAQKLYSNWFAAAFG